MVLLYPRRSLDFYAGFNRYDRRPLRTCAATFGHLPFAGGHAADCGRTLSAEHADVELRYLLYALHAKRSFLHADAGAHQFGSLYYINARRYGYGKGFSAHTRLWHDWFHLRDVVCRPRRNPSRLSSVYCFRCAQLSALCLRLHATGLPHHQRRAQKELC